MKIFIFFSTWISSVKYLAIGSSSVLWSKKYNLLNHMEFINIMIVHKNLFLKKKLIGYRRFLLKIFIFFSTWISSVKFLAIGSSSVLWSKKYNLLNHMEFINIMIVHKNLILITKIDRLTEVIVENFIFLSQWISSVIFLSHRNFLRNVIENTLFIKPYGVSLLI